MISRRNNEGVLRIAPATYTACDKGVGTGHGTTYVDPESYSSVLLFICTQQHPLASVLEPSQHL